MNGIRRIGHSAEDVEVIIKHKIEWDTFEWHMKRGEKDYEREKPMPPRPADDDDYSPEFAYWIGYMLARGKVLMKRWQVERDLRPDPNEPRPRKAA